MNCEHNLHPPYCPNREVALLLDVLLISLEVHLHDTVIGSSSTLRGSVVNVLGGIFDIASLAVQAILSVNLQFLSVGCVNELIHTSGAVP